MQKAGLVPDDLTDLIVGRAEGNAFYVEEFVKMLIEDQVIETGDPWDPWQIHLERLDAERVPATLTGVLQARLDSLAPPEREALQRSSVVGRVFWDGTVAALGQVSVEATRGPSSWHTGAGARVPPRAIFFRQHRRVRVQARVAQGCHLRNGAAP